MEASRLVDLGDEDVPLWIQRSRVVDALSEARVAVAARLLFRAGFDTIELAALFSRTEPAIVGLLYDVVTPS